MAAADVGPARAIDRTIVPLLTIIGLGLVVRLIYVIWYPQQPVAYDATGYDQAALAVLNGHYPPAGRALYPAFLAAIYWAFGHSYADVRVAQAGMVSVIALIAFLLGRDVFGRRQGLMAAALVSFYPGLLAYSGLLLTETLFALLIAAFAWCLLQAWRGGGLGWALGCGFTLGLATLCRSEIVGLALPAGALLTWKHSWPGIRQSLMLPAAMALVIAPAVVMHKSSPDRNAPVTDGVGATLWLSTYPGDWLEWHTDREPLRSLLDCNCSAEELNRRFMREAVNNVVASPGRYALMSVKRFGRFWVGGHSNVIRGLESSFQAAARSREAVVLSLKGLLLLLNTGLLALAAAGVYAERASWRAWLPLLVIVGYMNLVHIALFSTSRYQIPIMPLVAVLAAPAGARVVAAFVPGIGVRLDAPCG